MPASHLPRNAPLLRHTQVEDMLRRSFAEFHAQRAQPGKTAALAAGQAQLAAYQAAPWPCCIKGCSREDVEAYVQLDVAIAQLTERLQVRCMSARMLGLCFVVCFGCMLHAQHHPGACVRCAHCGAAAACVRRTITPRRSC